LAYFLEDSQISGTQRLRHAELAYGAGIESLLVRHIVPPAAQRWIQLNASFGIPGLRMSAYRLASFAHDIMSMIGSGRMFKRSSHIA
jgi:hypothetical protein